MLILKAPVASNEVIKFPFKRKACQVYKFKCHKKPLCTLQQMITLFCLIWEQKHHSEKLVILELTNHILPKQA